MTTAYYKSDNNNKSDNNEDKICRFWKNEVGRSRVKSYTRSCDKLHARLHDHRSCDYSFT